MTRQEFIDSLTQLTSQYIASATDSDADPQLAVDPQTLLITIADTYALQAAIDNADVTIENAANADDDRIDEATQEQVDALPDYYALAQMARRTPQGALVPDKARIAQIADIYFPARQ